MNTSLDQAVALVLAGEASMTTAAKLCGKSVPTVSRAVKRHPDYAKAQAAGHIKSPMQLEPVSAEDVRNHPGVLAVVDRGLSYEDASLESGVPTMTLHRWVKRAYPDYAKTRRPGPRPAPTVLPEDIGQRAEFVSLKVALRTLAADLGVPVKDLGHALVAQA